MVGYDYYDVTIAGTSPMLQHNGLLSDPTNPVVRSMKEITGKRKKVDADHEALANLEFRGSLYTQNGEITMPARLLEANLAEGAKVSKEGKVALAGLFVEPDTKFHFAGPQTVDERVVDPESRLVVGVRVQTSRVMRCRPIFRDWRVEFRASVLSETVPEDMLKRWIVAAGAYKGLGDWRPRYGRYELVSMKKV